MYMYIYIYINIYIYIYIHPRPHLLPQRLHRRVILAAPDGRRLPRDCGVPAPSRLRGPPVIELIIQQLMTILLLTMYATL